MRMRVALTLVGLVSAALGSAAPGVAAELNAEQARRFVIGKLFSFQCFEGTSGAGRISHDGSVSGLIRFRGTGPVRYVALPAGTLRVKGEAVCATLRGVSFEPCFDLQQTSERSFRGAVAGLGFAYCHFTRQNARPQFARALSEPLATGSTASVVKGTD